MPRRKLANENANARQHRKTSSDKLKTRLILDAVATDFNDDGRKNGRRTLRGNNYVTQERVFAREIKNIVGRPRTTSSLAPVDEVYSRVEELDTFSQLTANFGSLNLRNDVPFEIPGLQGKNLLVNIDTSFQPSTLFSREAFSSSYSGTCSVCKGKDKQMTLNGYESDSGVGDRTNSKSLPSSCQCQRANKRRSINTNFNVMKRSSFRSASIVSQSTPLLGKTARRSIRPFKPLEDESDLYPRFSVNQEPGEMLEKDMASGTCTACQTIDGAGDTSGDLMTQLASQLGEVVLSPCIDPVPDACLEIPEEERTESSQENSSPPVRPKNKADSFSLGFIPAAFPEEIDISSLRVVL